MKVLYLLRHGKSSWDNASLSDFERPLNKRGNRSADVMGRELASRGVSPDVIYSSPSVRTRETLEIIAPLLEYPFENIRFEERLYLAPAEFLIDFILHIDDSLDEVLLCGHNPGMEETARFFLGKRAEKFPTCAFLEVRFAGDSWRRVGPGLVKRQVFLYPRMFEDGEE